MAYTASPWASPIDIVSTLKINLTDDALQDIITDDAGSLVNFINTEFTAIETEVNSIKADILSGAIYTGLVSYDDTAFTTNIDCSLGNSFSKTVTANFTQTFSNEPASGDATVIVLVLTNAGVASAITWDTNIKWAGGTEPSWTVSGIDTVSLYTIDGGTNWLGNATLGYA